MGVKNDASTLMMVYVGEKKFELASNFIVLSLIQVVLFIIFITLWFFTKNDLFLFTFKTAIFSFLIFYLAPILSFIIAVLLLKEKSDAEKQDDETKFSLIKIAFSSAFDVLFTLLYIAWISDLGKSLFWVFVISGIFICIDIIGNIVKYFKYKSLSALENIISKDVAEKGIVWIYETFDYQLKLFLYAPFIVFIPMLYTIFKSIENSEDYMIVYFVSFSLTISTILIGFLLKSWAELTNSYIDKKIKTFSLENQIEISQEGGFVETKNKLFDLGYFAQLYRQLVLYNSFQLFLIILIFIVFCIFFLNIKINVELAVVISSIFFLIMIQVPYVLGQFFMREKITTYFKGIKVLEIKEEMKTFFPLFPGFDFLKFLTVHTSIGGLFYLIISKIAEYLNG